MKSPLIFFYGCCLSLLIGSCSEGLMTVSQTGNSDQLPIELEFVYPSATRATDNGFEDHDQMGVFVLDYDGDAPQHISSNDIHADNALFVYNESVDKWSSDFPLYWTSKNTPADIIGYYPYTENISDASSCSFSISRFQDKCSTITEKGGYEASDLLWAKAIKVSPTESKVELLFRHLLAGIRINLKEGSGFNDGEWNQLEKTVLVSNVCPGATVDLVNGEVGEAMGERVSVVPYHADSDLRAVVIPQTIPAGRSLMEVTIDKVSYHLVKNEEFRYVGGKLSTFTLTVDKRNDTGDYQFNLVEEAVVPWIDDVEFRDGIVRDYTSVHVAQRGQLKNVIEGMGMALSSIKSLKITGEIANEDFICMRDEMSALTSLNLRDCTVWDENCRNAIPEKAFFEKSTLLHIVFPAHLEVIGSGAFCRSGLMGTLILPEGLKRIGELYAEIGGQYSDGAFRECRSLSGELVLPSSIEFIEDCAFKSTNMRGEIHLPENLKHIGAAAFQGNKFSGELILPEQLEYLGQYAFAQNVFSGKCTIPRKIKTIKEAAFRNCGFDGVLSLHEGLTEIQKDAFYGCAIKGELILPSSLALIGERAFYATAISGIVFPEELVFIGRGAFAFCKYLNGTVAIPKKVHRISDCLFYGCSLLSGLIIHEDVRVMGGAVLSGCSSLSTLVCKAADPPELIGYKDSYYQDNLPSAANTFDGVSLSNISLKVPDTLLQIYRDSDGWREFKRMSELSGFSCRPQFVCALNSEHSETLIVDCDKEWELQEIPSWCTLSKSKGSNKTELMLTINGLASGDRNREGKIVFKIKDSEATVECKVSQFDYKYDEDECITLQKASRGRGIDVLFVGDGWDAASISDGGYLDLVNEQMEAFFGVEPFATYRDRFNVYACISLSQETGVNTPYTWRNTRFMTNYSFDRNTIYLQDENAVFDYAVANSPLTVDRMPASIIIVSLNNNEYGSSTTITEKGSTLSLCCSSSGSYPMDTRGIIQHEACGHGFGKLAEERIMRNGYMSDNEKNIISSFQRKGWYQNISLSGKIAEVWWRELVFNPRYSDKVDLFEGAYGKSRGVYRAEINSCMNYGIPYFSAPARLDIMRRILEYSGEGFTMEKFYETDSDKWGSTGSTRATLPDEGNVYVNSGLHHPVRIVKSKKY